jgi:peptide/nickel transport system ATP-binding protein
MVADRIAVMYLGRIVESGPADELCHQPSHPYTRALLGAVPALGRIGMRLSGEPANPLNPPAGCAFHPRCPEAVESCSTTDQVLLSIGPDAGLRALACAVVAPPSAEEDRVGDR